MQSINSPCLIKKTVREIWLEVLKVNERKLSNDDNFFLLGGDSLLMAQIKNRLQDSLSLDLSLSELFALSSISKMTRRCRELTVSQAYPASAAQCGLWFIQQLQSDYKNLYNTAVEITFKGTLNIQYLQAVLNGILLKHSVLRSNFYYDWKHNVLSIVESDVKTLELPLLKVSSETIKEETQKFCERAFDLERDLLIRTCLLQTNTEQNRLLVSIHHIVTDGWSGGIFLNELLCAYKAMFENNTNATPIAIQPLKSSYREYCDWQHQQVSDNGFDQEITFWKKNLNNLPIKRHYLKQRSGSENCCDKKSTASSYMVDSEMLDGLKALAAKNSISLFMLNLALFQLTLSFCSGETDIIVGCPVANRKFSKWEETIGYFVNVLVLRNKIDLNASFKMLLTIIKHSTLDAFEHQDVPFQELVKTLRNESQDISNDKPVFKILFAYQNSPAVIPDLAGLDIEIRKYKNSNSDYEFSLEITERPNSLSFDFEYSRERYLPATIEKFWADYLCLISSVINNPEMTVNKMLEQV